MTGAAAPPIPQVDPGAGYRAHRAEIDAAVARVLESGWYILGHEVDAFEAEFAAALGLGHVVGVASGTDALVLALKGLGIGPGHIVATVAHTAVATVAAIELAGAEPLLVDIERATFTLDPTALARSFEAVPGIAAVIVVHLYGQPADLPTIADLARQHGAVVIEDCAQCHGAGLGGRPAGSVGAAAAFSFYPTKNLGALGDGGAVATADPGLAERFRLLRQYGWRERFRSDLPGMNTRLDALQAAILRVRLPHLAAENRCRQAIADAYERGLTGTGLILPGIRPNARHVYHQYVVRHPARDRLRVRLAEMGIGTGVHYPIPVHLQPAYAGRLRVGPGGLAETEAAAREVLSLPIHPQLDAEAVARVVAALRAVV